MKKNILNEKDALEAIKGGAQEIKKAAQQGAFPNGTIPEGEKDGIGGVTKLLCSDKNLLLAYLEGRKDDKRRFPEGERPSKMVIKALFLYFPEDREMIKKACIGCSLSKDNESSFVRLFADDPATLEDYLKECPEGPMFLDSTFDMVEREELGIGDLLADLEEKYSYNQETPATTLADLMPA